jgi:hypothetical protein
MTKALRIIRLHKQHAQQEARYNQFSDARTKQQWAVVASVLADIERELIASETQSAPP